MIDDQKRCKNGSAHTHDPHFLLIQKEVNMGEVVHTSGIKIVREKGPTRRAMIEGFAEPIYYGVHGGIKKFYKVEPEKEHAAGYSCPDPPGLPSAKRSGGKKSSTRPSPFLG